MYVVVSGARREDWLGGRWSYLDPERGLGVECVPLDPSHQGCAACLRAPRRRPTGRTAAWSLARPSGLFRVNPVTGHPWVRTHALACLKAVRRWHPVRAFAGSFAAFSLPAAARSL